MGLAWTCEGRGDWKGLRPKKRICDAYDVLAEMAIGTHLAADTVVAVEHSRVVLATQNGSDGAE